MDAKVIRVNTKAAPVLKATLGNEVQVGPNTIQYPFDLNRWPLTTMWLFGAEKEVDHTTSMVPLGVIPWRIDVHERMEKVIGHKVVFKRHRIEPVDISA